MALPGFPDLWKTIQKGSFAYNALFLGITPFRNSSATDLADIITLKILFGDEFIDGIAGETGKPFIRELIQNDPDKIFLQKKTEAGIVSLQDRFDMGRLLTRDGAQRVNAKYQISYETFYKLLQNFLELINQRLDRLPFLMADRAADKITEACNTCFQSFLHDINSCPEPGNIPAVKEVLSFHETKSAYLQKKLLELRCILVNKEHIMSSIQTPGWLDIIRVIQIYDDINDAIIDDGIQDNLLLSVAAHYFPAEWEWFARHKHLADPQKEQPLLLSLYMPCSMEYCLQLAGNKIRMMNWEQQKIMHYLLFKNKYSLFIDDTLDRTSIQSDFLLQFYGQVKKRMKHLPEQSVKSYVIDTCVHLPGIRKQLLKKVNFSMAYQLRYNLLSVPGQTKASIFDTVTAK